MAFSGRRPLQERFPYATLLGSTVDTCLASVYEAFWKNFTRFIREGGTTVPEVDFSLPANMAEEKWPRSSSTAVACILLVCWSRCTSPCVPDVCRQGVAALVVNGSGMHSTGLLVSMHLALCSRRLPAGSGRARRQRQWHAFYSFAGLDAPRAVFPTIAGREWPRWSSTAVACILLVCWSRCTSPCVPDVCRQGVAALVVNGSGMHSTRLLVSMHHALCSRRLPAASGRARRQRQLHAFYWFAGLDALRAAFPTIAGRSTSFVQVLHFSSADVEKTAELPQLLSLNSGLVVACPLYATTGAVWSMTSRNSSTVVDVL